MSEAKLEDFHLICKLGEGTFSEVMKVKHKKSGRIFAMKRFRKHYMSLRDVNDLQEVYALRLLNPHPCIIDLYNVIYEKNTGTVTLNFELMSSNLYELISKDSQTIPESTVKQYMYQILVALEYIHSKGIFHRDLKPENILVKGKRIKIADFGSCRDIDSKPPYTEYIATRWYRSPECLLCNGKYSYKMDMWSAGCVMYEVISKNPLFPGNNELDQIHKIHNILGTPDPQVLKSMLGCKTLSPKYTFAYIKGSGLKSLIPKASKEALKLIYDLLIYDPKPRINATKALESPFFLDTNLDDVEISFLKNIRPLTLKSGPSGLQKKSKSKTKKSNTKINSTSVNNNNTSLKSKSKQNIAKNKQNDKKNKENINENIKRKDDASEVKNINKNSSKTKEPQKDVDNKNIKKNKSNENNSEVNKKEEDKVVVKTISDSNSSLDSNILSTSILLDQLQVENPKNTDNNSIIDTKNNEVVQDNTVNKVPNFKEKTYKIDDNDKDIPLDKNLSLTKIFYDNCIENSNKMNDKSKQPKDNNNVKMPEIDQSLSNSYNTIFHKNKNITKINNYEYRIINLNDLKNKNNNHKFGNNDNSNDTINGNNKNYKHIPFINNDKDRTNHYNNILAKKKDKKLNQVLKPGGEGMQYLISTLKKYQVIQQKQQQRKKQKQKYYNMQSESDEEMNDSFQNPFNKFNGMNIGNYNNQHPNYKNYMYDNKINNLKTDMKKESNNYNGKLPIINPNNNPPKKYGIVNQNQMIFKRNNDADKNQQISNNQEKNSMFLPSLKKKTKNN